jgi:hypothetical protein
MATHKVIMKIPPREIKRADASFVVRRNGRTYGTLEISNGSVVWFPANTTYGHKLAWEKFHRLMLQEATRFEVRKSKTSRR